MVAPPFVAGTWTGIQTTATPIDMGSGCLNRDRTTRRRPGQRGRTEPGTPGSLGPVSRPGCLDSLRGHPRVDHLKIFKELCEDEAAAGGDLLLGRQSGGDHHNVAVLLGIGDLSPLVLVPVLRGSRGLPHK